jgi:hypothetical protein
MRDSTMIIIVLVVAVIFIGPIVFQGFSDLSKDLSNWVKYGWQDETTNGDSTTNGGSTDQNKTGGEYGGSAGVGVIVHYADGSSKEVSPEGSVFNLPFAVYFEGQEVDYIEWSMAACVDWQGDLTNLKVSGTMQVVAQETGTTLRSEGVLKTFYAGDISDNQWFEIWSFSLDAEDIQYSLSDGDYTLVCSAGLDFEAMFTSGNKSTGTASPSTNLPITVETDKIMAIMCEIQPAVITT